MLANLPRPQSKGGSQRTPSPCANLGGADFQSLIMPVSLLAMPRNDTYGAVEIDPIGIDHMPFGPTPITSLLVTTSTTPPKLDPKLPHPN
ncbi:hypothetical protein V6N11_062926 [Hibiscus sabdariffa]|uniref:Uncharacterized protein n=1 Tax=Hibiscus sabdariffa TaxID=183260 RepID=A0ABR2NPM5_9ROSI